ncbi:MAG: DUF2283 domain-containing protein [Candidatus Heimdallarchaeaceae archaeon]
MMEDYTEDYDKENDIFSSHWGNQTKYSIELFDGNLILDLDKDNNMVGMEILDFMQEVQKHDKKMEKIFNVKPPKSDKKSI